MSTATPFKALGYGNGFPFCLSPTFTFPYSYTGSPSLASFEGLEETMQFFWLFERMQVSFDVNYSGGTTNTIVHDSDTTWDWIDGQDWYDADPVDRVCERPPSFAPGQIRFDTPATGVTTGRGYFFIEESGGTPHARILIEFQGATFNNVTIAVTSLTENDEWFVDERTGFFGWGVKLSGPQPITMNGTTEDLFVYVYMSQNFIDNGVTVTNLTASATFYTF